MNAISLRNWLFKVFPIVMGVCAASVMFRQFYTRFDLYGWITVLIAIIGIWKYYKNDPKYDKYYYAWVVLQFPDFYFFQNGLNPIANAFPISDSWLEWITNSKSNRKLELGINWGVLLLSFTVAWMRRNKAIGQRVILGKIRRESFPGVEFPVFGTVMKISGVYEGKAHYVLSLEQPLNHDGKSYSFVIVIPAEGKYLRVYDHVQRCALRVCDDIDYERNPKGLIADWIFVERA